jgi:8-oxo-dGTP diphosphatase
MKNKIVIAVKGIILNNGQILIVKRNKNDEVGADAWECVGGKIEFGEELEAALIREVKEEVGLDITIEKLLYATTFLTNPTRQVVILTYLCRSDMRHVRLSTEHSDYLWVTKSQLEQLLLPSIVEDFKKNNIFLIQEIM